VFDNFFNIKDALELGKGVAEIVSKSQGHHWYELFVSHPKAFEVLVRQSPDLVRAKLRVASLTHKEPFEWYFNERSYYASNSESFESIVKGVPLDVLQVIESEVARELAARMHHPKDPRSPTLVLESLGTDVPAAIEATLYKFTQLWVALKRIEPLTTYDDSSRLARHGLEEFVVSLVDSSPALWANSLHLLLQEPGGARDFVETLTISLVQTSEAVHESLRQLSQKSENLELRDRAHGLMAFAGSADNSQLETVNRLLDLVGRWALAGVIFPHPLALSSKTWLASHDAEAELHAGFKAGLEEFRKDFAAQGAKNERALVERALTELSVPFRTRRPVTSALGRLLGRQPKPRISLDHRTLVESEETKHGPDIAFLVNAALHGAISIESAEFVQVKKPKRDATKWLDSWTIDVPQLNDLLNTSQSSAYWLIDKSGDVLVVPSKFVRACMPAASSKTFTLHFNDVRSSAIPVDEFLADLLIGSWLGSTHETAKRIARGEILGLVPVHLVNIEVRIHGD
jgi:hypothetical protein